MTRNGGGVVLSLLAAVLLAVACAQGGNPAETGGDAPKGPTDAAKDHDDAAVRDDAAVHHDAAVPHDASVMHDAAVPHDAPPDADDTGTFCTGNDQCDPGYCCYIAICVQGTAIGALCIPSS